MPNIFIGLGYTNLYSLSLLTGPNNLIFVVCLCFHLECFLSVPFLFFLNEIFFASSLSSQNHLQTSDIVKGHLSSLKHTGGRIILSSHKQTISTTRPPTHRTNIQCSMWVYELVLGCTWRYLGWHVDVAHGLDMPDSASFFSMNKFLIFFWYPHCDSVFN